MPSPKTVTSTVAFQDSQGNVVASGTLVLTLSQAAEITSGGGLVANKTVSLALTAGGLISGTPSLWANDQLTPSGTTYLAELLDSGGNIIANFGQWNIAGASPIDLSQMIPVSTSTVSNPAPVLISPSGSQSVSQPSGTSLNVNRFEAIRFADQFSGASVGAQIDAACADLGSSQGLVIIPSTMGLGSTIAGIPDNVRVMDLRGTGGPNNQGDEAQPFLKDVQLRGRWTTSLGGQQLQTLHVHAEPWSGGQNNSPKTNYATITNTLAARTKGQHQGTNNFTSNFGDGDMIGFFATSYGFGSTVDAGGEGTEAFSGLAAQGQGVGGNSPVIFSGTVATNTSGVLTFTSPTAADSMGENRPVIITTPAKVYSTGTVTGISGTPPTVTGSGTGWGAQFGTGAKTNLFFALDADVNGTAKFVLQIASITDDTHLVLTYTPQGANAAYPTSNTGTYKIYKGGVASAVGVGYTSITVSPFSDFAVSDTFEQVLGNAGHLYGGHFTISTLLPNPTTKHAGVQVDNTSPSANPAVGYGIQVHSFAPAQFDTGLAFDTKLVNFGIRFFQAVGSGGVGPLIRYDDATSNATVGIISVLDNSSVPHNLIHFQRGTSTTDFCGLMGTSTGAFGNGTLQVSSTGIQQLGSSSGFLQYTAPAIAGSVTTGIVVVTHAATSQKSESAADTNVLTFTPAAAASTYRLHFVLSLSAANAATLGWTATWTDSNGAAQTPTNLALFQTGVAAPALTFTTSAAGNYYGDAIIDINNSATNIVIKLTFSGTSFTGKASATIERLQ